MITNRTYPSSTIPALYNTSTPSTAPDLYSEELHNAVLALQIIVLLLTLCLIAMLVVYLFRSGAHLCFRNDDGRYMITKTAILSAMFLLVRLIVDFVRINVPYMKLSCCSDVCRVAGSLSSFSGNTTQFLPYLYMWIRVYKLYQSQHKVIGGKSVYFTAALWICLSVFCAGITFKIFYSQYSIYTSVFEQCTLHGCISNNSFWKKLWTISVLTGLLLCQSFILVLIILLLKKMTPFMAKTNKQRVEKSMKRLALCTTVCASSDALMYIIELKILLDEFYQDYIPVWVFITPWNITLFINILALLCSSQEVKCPACCCGGEKENKKKVTMLSSATAALTTVTVSTTTSCA